jgi:hypothetical protein
MNDDTDKPLNTVGDDALEARITAWVLGEASSFEAGELEKLCAADPALGLFEQRLRVLHGLVAEDFKAGPAAEWKLSAARRAKITDLLGVEPEVEQVLPRRERHRGASVRGLILALAACVVIGLVSYSLLGGVGVKSDMAMMKESARVVTYSAPASDAMAQMESLRLEAGSLRLEREGGAPVTKPESASPQLAQNSAFTSKSPPAPAAEPAPSAANEPQLAIRSKQRAASDGTMDLPAESAPEIAARTGEDYILPAEGGTIPAPAVTQPLTSGIRSGDGAVTRNNIDAILNNPARQARAEGEGEGVTALTGRMSDPQIASVLESAEDRKPDTNGREEATTFGDLDAMGRLAEESKPQPEGLYYHSRTDGQVTDGITDLSDLAKKQSEAQPSSEVIAGRWFGTVADDSVKGLKDANAPGGAPADPFVETPLAPGQPLGGFKRDLSKDLADAPADAEGEVRAKLLEEVEKAWDEPAAPEAKKEVALSLMAEVASADEPYSTFSLHVSDASFKLAQAAMERGEVPAAEGIRPEEFYNAFDYGDPAPASGEPVVCVTEQSAHPAFAQRNLLRIGVRTGSQGRGASTPLNLTLLLDHSGSMEREDRNAGLAMAVRQLSGLLKEGDTITVAGFSRQPRLLADRLPGARAQELNELIARTPSEGGTNLEEGLKLGEELAKRQFNPAAQNRVVLFTDGAANLGDARPEALQARIEGLRQQGIAFDAAGFGADGLNDKLLERLTRNGNGRYYVVDGPEDADAGFAKQLAGAFRPAAENVKVQVRFNPARVAKYKLIGFEEHRLKKEDFRNDAVDAAEMAAEEAGNALYQIETLPQGEGEVGEVSVRFRDVASGQMVERTWTIPYDAQAPAFDKATPSIQLAGLAAFTAEKLRAAPMADAVDFQQLGQVYAGVRARYPNSQPVADLGSMIGKMK